MGFAERVDAVHEEYLARLTRIATSGVDDRGLDEEYAEAMTLLADQGVGREHPYLRPAVHSDSRRELGHDLITLGAA